MRYVKAIVCAIGLVLTITTAAQEPQLALQDVGAAPLGGVLEWGSRDTWVAQTDGTRAHVFEVESGRRLRTLEISGTARAGTLAVCMLAAHPTEDVVFLCDSATGAVAAVDVRTGGERWRTRIPVSESTFTTAALHLDTESDTLTVFRSNWSAASGGSGLWPTDMVRLKASTGAMIGTVEYLAPGALISPGQDPRWYVRMHFDPDDAAEWLRYQIYETGTDRAVGPRLEQTAIVHSGSRRAVLLAFPMETAGTFELIDVESGRRLAAGKGYPPLFSADGSKVIISAVRPALGTPVDPADPSVPAWRVIDAVSGRTLAEAPSGTPAGGLWALSRDATRVATVHDGRLLIMTLGGDVDASPPSSGAISTVEPLVPPNAFADPAGAFTEDGTWFVARARDGQFDVFDMATGTRVPFRLPAQTGGAGTPRLSGAFRVRPNPDRKGTRQLWRPLLLEAVDMSFGADNCLTAFAVNPRRFDGLSIDSTGLCQTSPDGTRMVVEARMRRSRGLLGSIRNQLRGGADSELAWMLLDITNQSRFSLVATLERSGDSALWQTEATRPAWSPDGRWIALTAPSESGTLNSFGIWRADTGQALDLSKAGVGARSLLGFVPESDRLVVANDSEVSIIAPDTLETILRLPASAVVFAASPFGGIYGAVNLATNGLVWVGPDQHGALWIRSAASGDLLGELRLTGNGEWLVTTPTGLFDGSPGGWRQIAWRSEDARMEPGELFFNEYFQPGLLAELLAGRAPRQVRPVADVSRRPPMVTLTAAPAGPRTARVVVTVTPADSEQSSGARDLRLFRNGVLVRTWRGELSAGNQREPREFIVDVPLVAGSNRFVAYAFNRDNIKSPDAVATLEIGGEPRPAAVYTLAIGIDRYTNAEFNLRYAVADATAFAGELARRQRELGATEVHVVTLLDQEATRENILFALARLSGTATVAPSNAPSSLAALAPANPEDTVAIYFAGHGLGVADRFHLIPANLAYAGPRESAGSSLGEVLANAISDRDLEEVLEPLDARHLLLVIDACDSGLALESREPRLGPMNSRGLAQLAYEKGMTILAASQAYQAALEATELQHGYLTYALVEEGLKRLSADTFPEDGEIRSIEWVEYAASRVPQLQLDAMDRAQASGRTLRFDVGPRAGAGRLQTPRVFWRRDDPERSFLVARP